MVKGQFFCAFLCVGEPRCYSFNVAEYPDSNGLYLCELLVTDKYRATGKLFANATFHHFSPGVGSPYIFGDWKVFLSIEIVLFVERSRSIFSLHVKALPVRTVASVILIMSGTPINVTVSLDSAELTANEEVWNSSCAFFVLLFFFSNVENYICREFWFNFFCDWSFSLNRLQL